MLISLRPARPGLLAAALLLAACGGPAPSSAPSASVGSTGSPPPATASPTAGLTPVPGGASSGPGDPGRPPSTTVTEWGTILDRVPEGFPVFPGAGSADGIDEPLSGAWLAAADVEAVAAWYADAFTELGWSRVDLGSALEDGTRVLDLASDLPECRVQLAFRPADASTIVAVLYGAGCAGGGG